MKSTLVVKGPITKMALTDWEREDANGNLQPGSKTLQVNMAGNFSFRLAEGDPNYLGFLRKVRVGHILEIEAGSFKYAPFKTTRLTDSGGEVEVTTDFYNLDSITVLSITPAAIPEAFAELEDAEGEITAVKRVAKNRNAPAQRGTGLMDTSALQPVVGAAVAAPPDSEMPG